MDIVLRLHKELETVLTLSLCRTQQFLHSIDFLDLILQSLHFLLCRQSRLIAYWRQAHVCVVMTKGESILGTGSEHSIWFLGSLCNKIVDQDSDICIRPSKDDRLLILKLLGGVDACHYSLGCGFFISAGSIGLACNKEVSHNFGFQGRQEVQWIQVVILHGICRPHYLAVPQSRKRPDKLVLYFLWQR